MADSAVYRAFAALWRPFIGWICGLACAWNWVVLPMLKVGLLLSGVYLDIAPADMSEILPLLIGLLGLSGYRTYEKVKGVA